MQYSSPGDSSGASSGQAEPSLQKKLIPRSVLSKGEGSSGKMKGTNGISPPRSREASSAAWKRESENVAALLEEDYPAEGPSGLRARERAIASVENLLNNWIAKMGSPDKKGKVFTSGGHKLGLINAFSDIDMVCVVPRISAFPRQPLSSAAPNELRDAFFREMEMMLQKQPGVTGVHCVPAANNPILACKFDNIDCDICFCDLDADTVPDDVCPDSVLANLDAVSQRAINGVRVATMLLEDLVPNTDVYLRVLRFVKCWAKRRAIYSTIFGYFGGIAWAICVAKTCQNYPNYTDAQLITVFFEDFTKWEWATQEVALCPVNELPKGVPEDRVDKKHIYRRTHNREAAMMAVLTPAFPSMNSTYNVSQTTKQIILDELRRAATLCKGIKKTVESKKSVKSDEWRAVYEPIKFFDTYQYYLRIEAQCLKRFSRAVEKFSAWEGAVQSKLRALMSQIDAFHTVKAQLFTQTFETVGAETVGAAWYIGLHFRAPTLHDGKARSLMVDIDLRPIIANFMDMIGPEIRDDGKRISITIKGKNEIPADVRAGADPLTPCKREEPTLKAIKRVRPEKTPSGKVAAMKRASMARARAGSGQPR